jgi:hypothetical protein
MLSLRLLQEDVCFCGVNRLPRVIRPEGNIAFSRAAPTTNHLSLCLRSVYSQEKGLTPESTCILERQRKNVRCNNLLCVSFHFYHHPFQCMRSCRAISVKVVNCIRSIIGSLSFEMIEFYSLLFLTSRFYILIIPALFP